MTKALQAINQDHTAEGLIAQAIEKNISVESMEKLLAMRREIRAEQAKEAYDRSMAAFQSDCPVIEKTKSVLNSKDKTVRYKYAPIESIVTQVKDLLKEHGFSYAITTKTNGVLTVFCRVTHEMGHSETSEFSVPMNPDAYMTDQQKAGAALTFAKRYAFCNAFGILTGDEDTDARPEEKNQIADHKVEMITAKQITMIHSTAPKKGISIDRIKEHNKVESIKDLTKDTASKIIDALMKRPNVDREDMPSTSVEEYDGAILNAMREKDEYERAKIQQFDEDGRLL